MALQLYVDYLERLNSATEDSSSPADNHSDTSPSLERSAGRLEEYMCSLRDDCRGKISLTTEQRYVRARDILRTLFGPAREIDGSPLPIDSGCYEVGRDFWRSGMEARKEMDEIESQNEEHEQTSSPALISEDVPSRFPQSLAALIALTQQALGTLVSQSEAARRLGITPRGVTLRIARGVLRNVEVDGRILIFEHDLPASKRESLHE